MRTGNHLLMIVTLSDSATMKLAESIPTSPDEAYRKGVALDLLELRRKAHVELSHVYNAVVIDAPRRRAARAWPRGRGGSGRARRREAARGRDAPPTPRCD